MGGISTQSTPEYKAQLAACGEALAVLMKNSKAAFSPNAIAGKSKHPIHVRQRAILAHALRAQGFSYSVIGRTLNRNHTTIIYLLKFYDKDGLRILSDSYTYGEGS